MFCALHATWVAAVICSIVTASSGSKKTVTGYDRPYEYGESSPPPSPPHVSHGTGRDEDGHPPAAREAEMVIVRPVSYTYFSSNLRGAFRPGAVIDSLVEPHRIRGPALDIPQQSEVEHVLPQSIPISSDNVRQQTYVTPYQEENRALPPTGRRTVKFPLSTVLPGNSLSLDRKPHPGLIQAVSVYSDLPPSRKAEEGVPVMRNTASLPATRDGTTTASRTGMASRGTYGEGGSYPQWEFPRGEFTETAADRDRLSDRAQRLRAYQGADGYPAESHFPFKTGHGGGGSGKSYGSENGEGQEDDHHATKAGKREKEYKKGNHYEKQGKGYHDKERDSSDEQENLKKEKKYHKDEEFYGEHHKSEKGGKGKKYGEGGKHKKGHTTHGEHNIVKKDEYIKNTKFYDEDHGGGEHEEHGEFYGQHEEKQGGNKEGKDNESKYEKKNLDKSRSHDNGHEEEEHRSRDAGSGHEKHYEREEEYGGKKGGHTFKKWGSTFGDHR